MKYLIYVVSFFLCVLLGGLFFLTQCTLLFQPCGKGDIPSTEELEANLRRHVVTLAGDIGERNLFRPEACERAIDAICNELENMGYRAERQYFTVPRDQRFGPAAGRRACNIEARLAGSDPTAPPLIIGAHYDTRAGMPDWHAHGPVLPAKTGTPGANDNGSGVAAVLELARMLRGSHPRHGVIFVFYANEEAPFYQTDAMGSRVHARRLAREFGAEGVMGMFTPETLGCYSPRVNKKRRTALVAGLAGLPDRCDYVAFMSTNTGKNFARRCAGIFGSLCRFPVRQAAFPYYAKGVSWSDDWSYMKEGIPSFAVTDTAFLRCDDYHETSDTPDKLDYREFAEVVLGLGQMTRRLVGAAEKEPATSPAGGAAAVSP